MPFVWGRQANDCVSYCVGAVIAQTGMDPLPETRFGDWTSERGALRLLKTHGGLKAMAGLVLMPVAPAMAQRGDIAGVPDAKLGIALMVVEGATLAGPGEFGTKRLPRQAMVEAWSIDRG